MSRGGDSTRDWLLKKLLKASKVLSEQEKELQQTKQELHHSRANSEGLASTAQRLAERVDDLEFEIQQLKRVPPIAPNLTVFYHTQRGPTYKCDIDAVQSAHGETTIHVRHPRG